MDREETRTGVPGLGRFVAFDTETTGMWAFSHRLVEVAAVRFGLCDGYTETFQALINPQRPIPFEVTRIHGITDEMVAGAEPVGPVLERFIEFCRPQDILIAHNAPFDISFIAWELDRSGLKFGANPVIDTVDIFRYYFPEQPSYSLLSLVRRFRIAETQEHRALGDAVLVQRLFCLAAARIPEIGDLENFKTHLVTYAMTSEQLDVDVLPDDYGDINQAVREGLPLEIAYSSPGKPVQLRVIRPTRIHRHNAFLYLNAFCERAGAERTFRLDRIVSFRLLKQPLA